MVQLHDNLGKFQAAGGAVVAISYDSIETLEKFKAENNIGFPLLADPESTVIKAYGILNEEAAGRFAGIPHPTTFIVDREGVVRSVLFEEGYRDRHTVDELVEAFRKEP